MAGGLAGLLLARWGIDALAAGVGGRLPRAAAIRMDPVITVFALALAVVTGLAFGLVPAIRGSRAGLRAALEGEGDALGTTADRAGLALRRGPRRRRVSRSRSRCSSAPAFCCGASGA